MQAGGEGAQPQANSKGNKERGPAELGGGVREGESISGSLLGQGEE